MAWTRDDSWRRTRGGLAYDPGVGMVAFPTDERWVTFKAEVPPELAELLMAAQRKSLGVNYSPGNATKANLVRAALRMYLNHADPEREAPIEGSARDVVDLVELPVGAT